MFNNSVIRVFIVPPSFLAYVIVRIHYNLTVKLLPKQEGAGSPYSFFIYFILFKNQIQTTSASPCRILVQPSASFLVCSLIFIDYKMVLILFFKSGTTSDSNQGFLTIQI